jgi:hypothetical protein
MELPTGELGGGLDEDAGLDEHRELDEPRESGDPGKAGDLSKPGESGDPGKPGELGQPGGPGQLGWPGEARDPGKLGGPGQPGGQRPATGEPRVDAALARLDELAGRPVTEHRAIFEDVHRRLRDVLGELDTREPSPSPEDARGAGRRAGR